MTLPVLVDNELGHNLLLKSAKKVSAISLQVDQVVLLLPLAPSSILISRCPFSRPYRSLSFVAVFSISCCLASALQL
jgi:hypothetical protein